MIDLYGSPKDIEFLEGLLDTAIYLARLGTVELEPNTYPEPLPEGTVVLRKYRTATVPEVRYRIWIDRRETGNGGSNGHTVMATEEDEEAPTVGVIQKSRVRMGDMDGEDLMRLLHEPRSICRGNKWHKKCKCIIPMGTWADCTKLMPTDRKRCSGYEEGQ